jgi:hypothetical protein
MTRSQSFRGTFVALALAACSPQPSTPATARDAAPFDSLVLERTPCFGFCPIYRLRVSGDAEVRFTSANPDSIIAVDTVARWVVDSLAVLADRSGYWNLPDSIQHGTPACSVYRTDHPGMIVVIHGSRTKRVRFDTGCSDALTGTGETNSPLVQLRRFGERIDSLTEAHRWIRPASRR